MGRVTLKVCLKAEADTRKECVVRIRITKDRVSRYWALNMSVPRSSFNEKGTIKLRNWIKTNHSEHAIYNKRIYDQYKKADVLIADFEKQDQLFSADDIISHIRQGGKPDTLLDYFVTKIALRRKLAGSNLQHLRTADQYQQSLDRLTDFLKAVNRLSLPVRLLTRPLVLEYRSWLLERYKHNTASLKLACLRHITRQAMKDGLIAYDKYPFEDISITFKEKAVARLRENEIDFLTSEPRKSRQGKFKYVTDRRHARPSALLMYYMQGMRIGDFILLRRENYTLDNGQVRIQYNMGKSDKTRNVLLPSEAVELIQPYLIHEDGTPKHPKEFLFPYIISNLDQLSPVEQLKEINRAAVRLSMQVKILGEDIGLDRKLTPHIMRHSFGDLLRRNGVDLITIQMAFGHSDLRTTRRYLESFDLGAVDSIVNLYSKGKTVGKQNEESTGIDSPENDGEQE